MCAPFLYSRSQIEKYRNALQDIMNCFWDMSPLEFAQSKGLTHMDDNIGQQILDTARNVLAEEI